MRIGFLDTVVVRYKANPDHGPTNPGGKDASNKITEASTMSPDKQQNSNNSLYEKLLGRTVKTLNGEIDSPEGFTKSKRSKEQPQEVENEWLDQQHQFLDR